MRGAINSPLLQIFGREGIPFEEGPEKKLDFWNCLGFPNHLLVVPTWHGVADVANIMVSSLDGVRGSGWVPTKHIKIILFDTGYTVQKGLKDRKTRVKTIRYGWECPIWPKNGVRIPLGDLVQVMNACSFKKGKDRVDSPMSVYWLLTHDSVCSNIDACTSLGDFWSILSN